VGVLAKLFVALLVPLGSAFAVTSNNVMAAGVSTKVLIVALRMRSL
jgi:hypothetical protein